MVNGMSDQNPLPNATAVSIGGAPMVRLARATTTMVTAARTQGSGNHRSAQWVQLMANRSKNLFSMGLPQ